MRTIIRIFVLLNFIFAGPAVFAQTPTNAADSVKSLSLTGSLKSDKAQLQWSIAQNEKVQRFDIERSTNGEDFTLVALLFTTEKSGHEEYSFAKKSTEKKVYYRLKMVYSDSDYAYSDVLVLLKKEQ